MERFIDKYSQGYSGVFKYCILNLTHYLIYYICVCQIENVNLAVKSWIPISIVYIGWSDLDARVEAFVGK